MTTPLPERVSPVRSNRVSSDGRRDCRDARAQSAAAVIRVVVDSDSRLCPSGCVLSCAWRLTSEVWTVDNLPPLSNVYCPPGRAGGLPLGLECSRSESTLLLQSSWSTAAVRP